MCASPLTFLRSPAGVPALLILLLLTYFFIFFAKMKSHTPRRGCMGPWGPAPPPGMALHFCGGFPFGMDALTVLTHRAHRPLAVAAAIVTTTRSARTEDKMAGIVLAVRRR